MNFSRVSGACDELKLHLWAALNATTAWRTAGSDEAAGSTVEFQNFEANQPEVV
jgi:hypothetical protein